MCMYIVCIKNKWKYYFSMFFFVNNGNSICMLYKKNYYCKIFCFSLGKMLLIPKGQKK